MPEVPDPANRPGSRTEPAPSPAPQPVRDALAHFLANRRSHAAADAFRGALCSYVRELRDGGMPPERVLVAVKGLLHGSPLAVIDDAVVWSVGAYFDAP